MWKLSIVIGLAVTTVWGQEETPDRRLRHSADVLREVMSAPDRGIPQNLLERAQCVVVVPGMKKGAIIVGGDYGRGVAECRTGNGWSGPAAVRLGGGSFGAQLGVESTDVVMLMMNQRGMDRLEGDKFKIGADASAAIGPVGRTASAATDAKLTAEILTYSRAKGLFAGIALDGTTITRDREEDRKIYGTNVGNKEILRGEVPAPSGANELANVLNQYPVRR